MDIQYERFNARTFEAYAKISIDNGVRKSAIQKAQRGKIEVPLSELTDSEQYHLYSEDLTTTMVEEKAVVFTVHGKEVPVHDEQLAWALTYLMPHTRDILLLTYFEEMSLSKMAHAIGISKSAAHRQLHAALERMRELLRAPE